jgi:hypothetical protein
MRLSKVFSSNTAPLFYVIFGIKRIGGNKKIAIILVVFYILFFRKVR